MATAGRHEVGAQHDQCVGPVEAVDVADPRRGRLEAVVMAEVTVAKEVVGTVGRSNYLEVDERDDLGGNEVYQGEDHERDGNHKQRELLLS